MRKKIVSSQSSAPAREREFKSVDQAFSHYFPSSGSQRSKLRVRESGSELAERAFARITKLTNI